MRVAPVGLLCWHFDAGNPLKQAFELGCDLAALTHGHLSGILPAGAFAALVLLLLNGLDLRTALGRVKPVLRSRKGHRETLAAIEKAEVLSATPTLDWRSAIRELGEGWVAEEALAIALYAAMRADSFEDGVVMAVSHGGDSDSTGSIAGNLLGARFGKSSIPIRWLNALELRTVVEEIAADMFAMTAWDFSDEDSGSTDWIFEKYPPT